MDDNIDGIINFIYDTVEDPTFWPFIQDSFNQDAKAEKNIVLEDKSALSLQGHEITKNDNDDLILKKNTFVQDDSKQLLEKILPHFQRSLQISYKIFQLQNKDEHNQKLLNQLPVGILAVDIVGNILYKNVLAEQLLISSECLFEGKGKLYGASKAATKKLLTAFSDILEGVSEMVSMNIPHKNEASKIPVIILPSEKKGAAESNYCNLLIAPSQLQSVVSPEILQELYDLTMAESNTIFNLVNGLSVSDISDSLHITSHTVRAHLKSAFQKTHTHSQAELIRLILQGPAAFLRAETKTKLLEKKEDACAVECHEDTLHLRDGRAMRFRCYGSLKSTPILFFHSSFGSRLQHPGSIELYDKLGVCLIVPDRPGYGFSESVEGKATFSAYAEDIYELIHYLGFDKMYFLGYSVGAVYAQAVAYYQPQLCRSLSLVSSMAPFSSLADLRGVKPVSFKLALSLARYAPSTTGPIYRLVVSGIMADTQKYFESIIRCMPPPDAELLNGNTEMLDQFGLWLRESFRFGISGIENDMKLISLDWAFSPADVNIQATLWHGEMDSYALFPLAQKLTLIPNSKSIFLKDKGHFFLFDDTEKILLELLKE